MAVDTLTRAQAQPASTTEAARPTHITVEPTHEAECRACIATNPNMLVPWYLMASHAYHWMDRSIISNALYDEICKRLLTEWDEITHHHKRYVDRDAVACRTGNYLTERRMPQRAFWALQSLVRSIDNSNPTGNN